MESVTLYYATNRGHEGSNRWAPKRYGKHPSSDGHENLRFGKLTMKVDPDEVVKQTSASIDFGVGNGGKLSEYIEKQSRTIAIEAFEEKLKRDKLDKDQAQKNFGSTRTFTELRNIMKKSHDVLIYVHGFNVSWEEAVAAALSMQFMLNVGEPDKKTTVILFTWPSDGMAIPFVSYKSDRSDAELSGNAIGRGFLKLRDMLTKIQSRDARSKLTLCKQEVHLLCHSMGNYVLQNALQRILHFNEGPVLPRIFDHIFMCAPDIDENVFEPGKPLEALPELARSVSVYHNKGDVAMYVSDYTKNNPDRLGQSGASKPSLLHNKIHQIDCSPIVTGFVEHSYYLDGRVNKDIAHSIAGKPHHSDERDRVMKGNAWPNVWSMI